MGLKEWAETAPLGKFGGVVLYRDRVVYKRETQPLEGLTAKVETAGQLRERVTLTRVAFTGLFAMALKKKKDDREVFLTVEGPGFVWLIEVDRKKDGDARKFAAKVGDASRKAAALRDADDPEPDGRDLGGVSGPAPVDV